MTAAEIDAGQLAAILEASGFLIEMVKDPHGFPQRYRATRGNKVVFELQVAGMSPEEIAFELEALAWAEVEHHPPEGLCIIPMLRVGK